jgi:hypothetical protein
MKPSDMPQFLDKLDASPSSDAVSKVAMGQPPTTQAQEGRAYQEQWGDKFSGEISPQELQAAYDAIFGGLKVIMQAQLNQA